MFRFFTTSVTQQDGLLKVHTPASLLGWIGALFFAFLLLCLVLALANNPFRAARVQRALALYVVKVVLFVFVLLGFAWSVQSNDLTLDAKAHTATEENHYFLVFRTRSTYDLSRIQGAEVDGSRKGGADRLCLVFANGHVHSLTSNNMQYGKQEAAAAINRYLAAAQ